MVDEVTQSESTDFERKADYVKLFGVNLMEAKPQETKKRNEFGISEDLQDSQISSENLESPRNRRKGVAWTEDEHLRFLAGLQELGRGAWKGISKRFVKTKTPTQVASHAQKHFLRQEKKSNTKSRRQSIFDIPIDLRSRKNEDSELNIPSQKTPPLSLLEAGTSTSPSPHTSTRTSANANIDTDSFVLPLRAMAADQVEANNAWNPIHNRGYSRIIRRRLGPIYQVRALIIPMEVGYLRRD